LDANAERTNMCEALRLADEIFDNPDAAIAYGDAAAAELRRLAGVEAELQQAREERTALLVNEQNLLEQLAALRASLANTPAETRQTAQKETP
jgi:hypothetical protein